jgi:hypothetical protein
MDQLPHMCLFIALTFTLVESEIISRFHVPSNVTEGESALLICDRDHSTPRLKLYTHKWYKEQLEIWRFEPKVRPQIQTFPVPGIHIDVSIKTHVSFLCSF